MLCFNGDVERTAPVKFNLSLPKVLMDRFEETVDRYGSRHKGDAIAAAVLLFLQLEAAEQDRRVSEIVTAKLTGRVDSLMKESTADDNISPALLPERPEKVLHPKKRRTG